MYKYALGQDTATVQADPQEYLPEYQELFSTMTIEEAMERAHLIVKQAHIALKDLLRWKPLYVTSRKLQGTVSIAARAMAVHFALVEKANAEQVDLEKSFPSKYADIKNYLDEIDADIPSLSKFDPTYAEEVADAFAQLSARELEEIIYQGDLDSPFVPKEVKMQQISLAYSGQLDPEKAANIMNKYDPGGNKKGGMDMNKILIAAAAGLVAFMALK